MAAIRGSALPITIYVSGVDLTGATEITLVFARKLGQSPIAALTKTKSDSDITVTYEAGETRSKLTLTLADTETATLTGELCYTLYIDDGSDGGAWVPDNGGTGAIQFSDSVKKA
jgi:hypothetical protein